MLSCRFKIKFAFDGGVAGKFLNFCFCFWIRSLELKRNQGFFAFSFLSMDARFFVLSLFLILSNNIDAVTFMVYWFFSSNYTMLGFCLFLHTEAYFFKGDTGGFFFFFFVTFSLFWCKEKERFDGINVLGYLEFYSQPWGSAVANLSPRLFQIQRNWTIHLVESNCIKKMVWRNPYWIRLVNGH